MVNSRVEVRADENEGGTSHNGAYLQVLGRIVKEIRDPNNGRYFIIELENRQLPHRYLMVGERYAGDSIPREFSHRGDPVLVGIALVLNEKILERDTFEFDEVNYFAIGEIRHVR